MKADVVVLGAGLAGMSAAVTAAEAGARTVVLERGPAVGGSAAISGGYVWAIEDEDKLRAEDPGRFQRHGHLGNGRVFVAEVVPAITFTFGGIEVDASGLALGTTGDPIEGLCPAGADMSDVYHEGYGGGLCQAVVTGRRAGRLAATERN